MPPPRHRGFSVPSPPAPPPVPAAPDPLQSASPFLHHFAHRDDLKCNPRRRRGTKKVLWTQWGGWVVHVVLKKSSVAREASTLGSLSSPERERGKSCKRTKGEWVKRYFLNPFSVRRSRCLTVFFFARTPRRIPPVSLMGIGGSKNNIGSDMGGKGNKRWKWGMTKIP